jgi:VWFA-related protein
MRLPKPVILLTLALARLLHAQDSTQLGFPGADSQPASTAVPTIQVYSRETIFDVLVTDDKGQPVRGLTKSDFTVFEDNKPQPIRGFSEFDKATPPPPARVLPPDTFTNDNKLPTNGPVQIFLFDVQVTPPAIMQRGKHYIADYLRTMPPGTQVAIFDLSTSKDLVLLQDFTTDGKAAAAAVDNLDVEWDRPPAYARFSPTPIAIAGLNRIADYVAAVHGRKNLFWVLSGMPLPITRDGMSACSVGPPDLLYVHRQMDLYDIFTREQISIYPIDTTGVHKLDCGSLTQEMLAEATGGSTGNTNDFQTEIAKMVDQSNHGYTLSFVPPREALDGHYHTITVKLSHPGLRLSYREGYDDEQVAPREKVVVEQMTQGPMRLGAIPATQILFDLHIEPSSSAAPPAVKPTSASKAPRVAKHAQGAPYTAAFTIDPTQLALTQNPDGIRTASLELDLGAFDTLGKLVSARSQEFKLTVTPAQYNSFFRKPLHLTLAIDLPPGQLTLRAGVFDTVSNKAGTLEFPLTLPKK